MKIVALETTERIGSIAALESGRVVADAMLPPQRRTAQTLLPGLRDLMGRVGWGASDIGLVAVAVGPGSFTGLRIGLTAAKTFAYAAGSEIVGVDTLAAIAWRAPAGVARLAVALDAQRRQVFAASFARDPRGAFVQARATQTLDLDQWFEQLSEGDWISGPALVGQAPQIPSRVRAVDESLWRPTAAAVGQLGWSRYESGHRDDLWQLLPEYHRASAAEEKWADRESDPSVKHRPE